MHKTPISFDAAQWEFLANATGAAVVVGDPDLYRDPEALIDAVTTHQVTHLQVVPTLLQALCEEPTFSACTSLRLVASGGESLSSRLGATAVGMLPAARIMNVYGPTETTINSSFYPLPRPLDGPASAAGVVPIGLPVDGLAFHLLVDEAGELTDSATGEIGISGLQLARGYRNRPEETDRRFVTRVINGTPTRLYRTGDVGELIDGIFHFRGRADSQVKIRGHRIKLDEIRNALENHEWVRHAGVLTVDRGDDDAPRLVAHVELNPHEAAVLDQGVHHTPAQVADLGPWKDPPFNARPSRYPSPRKMTCSFARSRSATSRTGLSTRLRPIPSCLPSSPHSSRHPENYPDRTPVTGRCRRWHSFFAHSSSTAVSPGSCLDTHTPQPARCTACRSMSGSPVCPLSLTACTT